MQDWLTIELVLATLLVTTFTCVGLLSLWAATSPRHWYVRTGAILLAFSPLLLVPAYGPILTFLLVACFVVGGVAAYRRWQRRCERTEAGSSGDQGRQSPGWQFSVKSVLALCTCVAVLAAIAAKIPEETWGAWNVIAIVALIEAAITLVAAWIVGGRGTRRERIACAFAIPFVLIGSAIVSLRYSDFQLPLVGDALAAYVDITQNQTALLFTVTVGVFVALLISLVLYSAGFRDCPQSRPTTRRITWARVAAVAWTILLADFPLFVVVSLSRPLPESDITLPVPNGYDELVRIGKGFQNSAIMKELAADEVDQVKLDAAVPNYEAEFTSLRKALNIPFQIPIRYDMDVDIDTDAMGAMRNLAYVLEAKAEASLRTGDVDESLACCSDILRLTESWYTGRLLVHFLAASAAEHTATLGIYRAIKTMDAAQCKAALRNVSNYDAYRESFDQVANREYVWIAKISGWPGQLGFLLEQIAGDGISFGNVETCRAKIYPRDQAVVRLLIIELALRAYQLDHDQLPARIEALVPDYLSELPDDPFAPGPQPFHYVATEKGFNLWSVGPDSIDDGGEPLPKNEYGGNDLDGSGDIRLDSFFAPGE